MSDDQIIITTQDKLKAAFTPPQIETTEVLISQYREQKQKEFDEARRNGLPRIIEVDHGRGRKR